MAQKQADPPVEGKEEETPIQDWADFLNAEIEMKLAEAILPLTNQIEGVRQAIEDARDAAEAQVSVTNQRKTLVLVTGMFAACCFYAYIFHPLLMATKKAVVGDAATGQKGLVDKVKDAVTGTAALEKRDCIQLYIPSDGTKTSSFGARTHPVTGEEGKQHNGIDISAGAGNPVYSAESGVVDEVSTGCTEGDSNCGKGYGNYIQIDHGKVGGHSLKTFYGHLSEVQVSQGSLVSPKQIIGLEGNTGLSTGAHLHFEVLLDGQPVDPEEFISKKWGGAQCQ